MSRDRLRACWTLPSEIGCRRVPVAAGNPALQSRNCRQISATDDRAPQLGGRARRSEVSGSTATPHRSVEHLNILITRSGHRSVSRRSLSREDCVPEELILFWLLSDVRE